MNHCNADPANIIYTSVTEEYEEYVEVLRCGVRRVVVSSFNGMTNLGKVGGKLRSKAFDYD